MTLPEFSDSFDVLLNSYANNASFGEQSSKADIVVDEYEKSVFLTKAQEQIVKELYSGYITGGFEADEKLRRELEALVKTKKYKLSDAEISDYNLTDDKYNHTIFTLEEDCMYIIYEQVQWETEDNCLNGHVADVYPVLHDEYWRVRKNPFRGPNGRRVLRIDKGNRQVEIVSNKNTSIGEYIVRYVQKPEPIILIDLNSSGLEIEGHSEESPCKLDSSLHRDILERAVKLTIVSKRLNKTSE